MTEARRGPGRRPGSTDTRAHVLAAARTEFAAKGYDRTSVRGIARVAEVDPSLVHHYFGSKDRVFAAAMALPLDPGTDLPPIFDGPRDQVGERLVRFFLSVWGDAVTREPFLALLRSALSNEQAAAMLRGFVREGLFGRAVALVGGGPDREIRIEAAAAQLVGLALLRYVVKVEPLARASDEELIAIVAPVVQGYLAPP